MEKKNLTKEVAVRYRTSSPKQKELILDEFTQNTGYNRKYAIHVLNKWGKAMNQFIGGKMLRLVAAPSQGKRKRERQSCFQEKCIAAIIYLWTFFDYLCGKRLVILIRTNLEAICESLPGPIDSSIKSDLARISASTIDRILAGERKKHLVKGNSHTRSGPLLKHQIPIRTTYRFDERIPGFFEVDTVGHDGGHSAGEFCFTLTATDVGSGWVEVRALRNKAQKWALEGIIDIHASLPFPMRGLDSDNGGEFINQRLYEWCVSHGIGFTRSRSYHKNDNCFVEQKNDKAVRNHVGYLRYDTDMEHAALAEVYRHLCPLINYFIPSMKLIGKERIGSKVKKHFDRPMTPADRLLASLEVSDLDKMKIKEARKGYDLIDLQKRVSKAIQGLEEVHRNKSPRPLPPIRVNISLRRIPKLGGYPDTTNTEKTQPCQSSRNP
jgi:hypothetical protein